MYETSRQRLADVGFELRAWASNCSDLTARFLEDGVGAAHVADCERMLGYRFFPQEDKLNLVECYPNDVSYDSDNNISKRLVLSEIAKVFDPIGLTNPVLAKAKISLQ